AAKMKNLILVAVILQLVITISLQTVSFYEFGDMITLKRRCKCLPFLTYKHFVIYVDDEPDIPGRAQGQDIFHRTGMCERGGHDCKFGVLANEKGDNVKAENYLDGKYGLSKGTDNEIRTRIRTMISQCKEYRVFTNNCEHLATFVRYGKRFLQQVGGILNIILLLSGLFRTAHNYEG
uniref:LRAT domain-containing protein n=1 Tax=Lates calcarifer TaxID=8187 RepID=A0A4W6C637_LATCA